MRQLSVVPDAVAVCDDRLVAIVRIQSDGKVAIRDLANGQLLTTSAVELSAPPISSGLSADSATALHEATNAQWEDARCRESAVIAILQTNDVAQHVSRVAAEFGVSRRTVFRWLAAYRETPQTSALLHRPMGPPVGGRRIDAHLERLITEVINDVYLTKVRAKKEEVVRMVHLRCAAQGLKPPSRKPILVRLKALDPREVAKARLQPGEAASLTDFVPGRYRVNQPLGVVQIDHTLVDLIVVDEARRLPIGRPWLTLAVDVATRVIVGFYLSLEAPSSTSVALCLSHATLPKELWLKQRGLDCNWPVWGLPQAVHADNGADFTAAALRRGCDEHGIRLILRPVATPHYGGHIERLIGTLMGRVHLLPGTTGSNPQEKGDYPSEAQARMTLNELEQWLTLEICEQYHRRIHKGIGQSPLAAWQTAANADDAIPRSLPHHPDQFTISFLPFLQRKLRRDGLHVFNIRYWDNVLPAIVQLGAPLTVRYDPRNLSRIYVIGPDQHYHPVPYADLSLPPITLWEQRAAVAYLRGDGDNAPAQAAIFKAVVAQRALIANATARTKAARRQSQRQSNAQFATMDRSRVGESAVDYSEPVLPSDAEVWDD
jgi:putative transposase